MSKHEEKASGTRPGEEEELETAGSAGRSDVESGAAISDGGGSEAGESGECGEEEMDPVAALEAEVGKWKELALRGQADLDNYRKRTARDRQEVMRYANGALLETLLPILDNFEMGLEAASAESEESMIFQGMDMVMNQIRGFLEDQGVTEIEAAGQKFDPKTHEAVAQEASDEVSEGEIVRVMRRGFKLRDRLLRAPAVVVSTGPSDGEVAGGAGGENEGG